MAITKEKKEAVLVELDNIIKNATSVVFTHFSGLGAEDNNKLRANLYENDSNYRVVKKTLLKITLDKSKIKGEYPELDGEISIAYGSDMIIPAREVYSFQKEHKGKIEIIGGIFDGKFMNKEEMLEIAQIPGMKQLRGMFLNIINSPIQGFVSTLGQIVESKKE